MTEEEKEKIINTFNNAWSRKIASENSYGKLASKEMFENKEEIIIDGVDVAGCCLFTGGNCMQRMVDKNIIDDDVTCNGICDYGALYRKEYIIKPLEQERDELKKACEKCKLFDIEKTNRDLLEQIEKLEQENKELKEEKQAIKSYLGIESKTILERLEELDEWKHNDKLLLWKYRSALEEINRTLLGVRGLSIHCDKQIIKVKAIINEVLNENSSNRQQ